MMCDAKSKKLRFKLIFLITFVAGSVYGQNQYLDSLKTEVKSSKGDSNMVNTLLEISKTYFNINTKEAEVYAIQAQKLATNIGFHQGEAYALKNIGISYYFRDQIWEALNYWNQSLKVFEEINDKQGMSNILNNQGAVYFSNGSHEKALELYLQSLKYAEEINDPLRIATAYMNVGTILSNNEINFDRSLYSYKKALSYLTDLKDMRGVATTSGNIGDIYLKRKQYDSALIFYKESLIASEGTIDFSFANLHVGRVYQAQENFNLAKKYFEYALAAAEISGSVIDMSKAHNKLASIAIQNGFSDKALFHLKIALKNAEIVKAKSQVNSAYRGLSHIYAGLNKYDSAFKYQRLHKLLGDTLNESNRENKINKLLFSFDLEKKEVEIELLEKNNELQELDLEWQKLVKNISIGALIVLLGFLVLTLIQKKFIKKEKKRSEELLLNILPYDVAEELKEHGTVEPVDFDKATILFTDFKNFTKISERLTAREIVDRIDTCFKAFDLIMEKYNLEKIKTIGDAYMAAGGVPAKSDDSVKKTVLAALEMQEFMIVNKKEMQNQSKEVLEMRVGIHTGAVVAGVVGVKKFQYDIWGDTVNMAARLESAGEVEKVNISSTVFEGLKHDEDFNFEYRGKIEAKNKGKKDMYFVNRNYSVKHNG